MKAEVIRRGLIIGNNEVPVGEIINVSKGLFERSNKLAKPGTRQNSAGVSVAEQALKDGQIQLAAGIKDLGTKEKDLAARETALTAGETALEEATEELTARETAVTTREAALKK